MSKIILKTKKDTINFANQIAIFLRQSNPLPPASKQLKSPQPPFAKGGLHVVALVGELGVGKTFFTKALGKALGVKETIKSPSFNLMKIYEISVETRHCLVSTMQSARKIKTLIHVDCYRLNSPEELIDIGLLDYFSYNNTLIIIEWADKIKKILPKDTIWIKFEMGKGGARTACLGAQHLLAKEVISSPRRSPPPAGGAENPPLSPFAKGGNHSLSFIFKKMFSRVPPPAEGVRGMVFVPCQT